MRNPLSAYIVKEVPFYDVDSYRIAWHGCYPKYFEDARCALLDKIGYSYQQMDESDYAFPVIDLKVRYVKPMVFAQKVRVLASMTEWQHRLVINYLITDINSGDRLTKASTTQVAVLMPDKITQFVSPKPLIERVEAFLKQAAS